MSTTSSSFYSNLFGAAQVGDPAAELIELNTTVGGTLKMGSVISLVAGKGELTKATTETSAYGILLHDVDLAAPHSDGKATGSSAVTAPTRLKR
jgi:hypothetical protein